MTDKNYVIKTTDGGYIQFTVTGSLSGFKPFWYVGHGVVLAGKFSSREKAQACIDRWKKTSNPMPNTVFIEEISLK